MRKTAPLLILTALTASACKKESPPPSAPPAATTPAATTPAATTPADPATTAPAAVKEPSAAAANAPAPAAPAGEEVRPPTPDDLATYVADLKGKGPLKATIETSQGKITCELHEKLVPMTVANFVGLARGLKPFRTPTSGAVEKRPFYDGLVFHRVIPEFMIQGGDPLGVGRGDPGYRFPTELHPTLKHDKPGVLAMANAGPNTNGSQFYITEVPTPHLDGGPTGYNIFGQCKEVDVVKKIARQPSGSTTIKKVTITR